MRPAIHSMLLLAALLSTALRLGQEEVVLAPEEVALALEFSPLPGIPPDPTNRYYENEAAARFGQALFFDQRLSGTGTISCASCHDPESGWADGRTHAIAVSFNPTHTMTLWNVAHNRWFFWDGRKDSLWSQALAPFEDPREHDSSRLHVVRTVLGDEDYRRAYEPLFGVPPDLSDRERFPEHGRPVPGVPHHPHEVAWSSMSEQDRDTVDDAFVNIGKSIAAFERRLIADRAPWDVFVEGLRTGDPSKVQAISESAQRGFALFAGKARCHLCHDGPNFTDMEFHPNRVPTEEGVELGRPIGIGRLLKDPFNGASRHADDGGETARLKLRLPRTHAHPPGEWKTPTLRNVATTAPYMHEGQVATLEEVIEFYSTLENAAPAGIPNSGQVVETILQPLHLTDAEKAELLAFLEALTDDSFPEELTRAPETPYVR